MELSELLCELEQIKAQQKHLDEQEASYRCQVVAFMENNGIDKESTDYGSVRLQSKQKKIYPQRIRELENQFKEAKKLADAMGDYESQIQESTLVYTPPLPPF